MSQQSDGQPFAGPHPSNRDFVDQLTVWGFTQRKEEGVHIVFRGPRGGTLRVVRSLLGRADADRVDKAARLAGVTPEQFWTGPESDPPPSDKASEKTSPAKATKPATPRRRRAAHRDRPISLVLGVHAATDRPLGFDQVVNLAGGPITRDQVRTASAQLCRDGHLDRIRPGVYQWADGARARKRAVPPQAPPLSLVEQPTTTTPIPARSPEPYPKQEVPTAAAQLFDQLFPAGVRMTAELLADFERWAQLTEKLAAHAKAS